MHVLVNMVNMVNMVIRTSKRHICRLCMVTGAYMHMVHDRLIKYAWWVLWLEEEDNRYRYSQYLCQWFPTRGPRAKSGPPSLKMWPAALDELKNK